MTRSSSFMLGALLVAVGMVLALHALVLMFDTSTMTRVWMVREFGLGLCLAGWGVVAAIPHRWIAGGVVAMCLGTIAVAVLVVLQSQGVAS